jgi:hypothetical protein
LFIVKKVQLLKKGKRKKESIKKKKRLSFF